MPYNENTDLVRGEYMMLYVKEGATRHPIAFARSNSEDITTDTIETSNKMSGAWKTFLTGQSGWTLSVDALVSKVSGHYSYSKLRELAVSRQLIEVEFGYVQENSDEFELDTTKPYSTGMAFLTSVGSSSENGGIAECSASLQGSGPLTTVNPTT